MLTRPDRRVAHDDSKSDFASSSEKKEQEEEVRVTVMTNAIEFRYREKIKSRYLFIIISPGYPSPVDVVATERYAIMHKR